MSSFLNPPRRKKIFSSLRTEKRAGPLLFNVAGGRFYKTEMGGPSLPGGPSPNTFLSSDNTSGGPPMGGPQGEFFPPMRSAGVITAFIVGAPQRGFFKPRGRFLLPKMYQSPGNKRLFLKGVKISPPCFQKWVSRSKDGFNFKPLFKQVFSGC